MSGSQQLDPRLYALLQQYQQMGGPQSVNPNAAGYTLPQQGPVAPGTPYAGPKPYIAGAYNTLAPSDFADYQASLQPADPNWVAPQQQALPGLMDANPAMFDPDRLRGAWSGGEGSGGNGGGQR